MPAATNESTSSAVTLVKATMKQHIGIWLDGKEAYIIPGGDDGKMQRISSDVDFREREPGEGKKFGRFGIQFLDQERQKERRVEQQIDDYLDAIIDRIGDADQIVVFGPSLAKVRLEKRIRAHHMLGNKLLAVESADAMTRNQMKAWVREFFDGDK